MTLREAFEQAEIAWHDDPNDDSRNAMLEAKVAWLELEAARYRWLRDVSQPGICAFYLSVGMAFKDVRFSRETVDTAIDAQIAAQAAPWSVG